MLEHLRVRLMTSETVELFNTKCCQLLECCVHYKLLGIDVWLAGTKGADV